MEIKVKSFIKVVASNAAPEPLSTVPLSSPYVRIKADPDNAGDVFIGDITGQLYRLKPGDELPLSDIVNKATDSNVQMNHVYVKVATGGDEVCVIYSLQVPYRS